MLCTWNNEGQKLNVAETLKEFRKKVNMTKKELAFECNIPIVTYEQTMWLLANDYLAEDFEIGDNWIIAMNEGGDISFFELENDYMWLQLLKDPDIAWRAGDRVFRCAIATVRPTVKIKILEEITTNNPLTE